MTTAVCEMIGWAVTVIAVVGVLLNNRQNRWCFAVWMISNTLSAALHAEAAMWALTARDAIFLMLAVAGWRAWGSSEKTNRSKKSPRPATVKTRKHWLCVAGLHRYSEWVPYSHYQPFEYRCCIRHECKKRQSRRKRLSNLSENPKGSE